MSNVDLHEDLKNDERVWMPGEIGKDVQRFNVFHVKHNRDDKFNCKPFNRKALFKISLLKGKTRLYYADKTVDFDCALLFTNPNIPYSWEHLESEQVAYFCVFTEDFFDQFMPIKDYPVFKPGNVPLFHLDEEKFAVFENIFKQMLSEITLEFSYKYDSLRSMVLQLIFSALKLEPATFQPYKDSNGSQRIVSIFTELLERQFPIESTIQRMELRHPTEFASQLSVHVNHLNHALKVVTGKTTSQLVAARIMQEAKSLLQHTDWNISEIAWSLGFDDLPHFINFFKKNQQLTPKLYRKNQPV
ncbi:helix-turn-helix domain-containing protein [Dyadobacter subterraneus]|uniref:Helix-turn-helix transcriptional regulator n=1 Tax=Dyadobacter subterraneus TaxID=2773304 RepID=A0ABR9W8V5_9BACT|nr:response regulator transcription factor [Dyadobacter subterraneus]MBE9461371.1 helix-turn-helix transcriptional regulator [Dyadobacter subterraneus]